ncbi:tetratricopeptide repeat protein [Ensifer adhaerens]|uniref:rhodanese-like domain-containing protein n=1 Tax=Ensifer adhaerens TaxID=106592 RepID=UPI001CC06926|nr:rhodanese-like domain-containing protein [Ensifer adhaerens]MBZ7922270.1 tetratricopeptide repeat protein [Ensifer adhaerens]UAX90912.1 tetratricopeptide repeat protein [Ensifer adhaerens]UAX98541.1 tetratricopeptide repeat protein [Ensifer adhaerens]UAY05922.1 tetratricopeptide repeat protein [Ensifer adhaerens]
MEAVRAERRLVAILAVDIVGYSRLMEADEARTLAAIKAWRCEIFDPLREDYHGRIVKLMGDGAIVEFGSVVDAVACAVASQNEVAARQTEARPEHRLLLRMGINLGDVVVDGDDLLGDGVNVAARLEQMCEPGGLFISGTAFDHLQGKFELPLEFIGEHHVKNIQRPVRVYRVRFEGGTLPRRFNLKSLYGWRVAAALVLLMLIAASATWLAQRRESADAASVAGTALALPQTPSIAVLPFENLSSDAGQTYFVDGMTDDLITELSKLSGIFVIARNSTFAYKGKPTKAQQVAEELGVHYILEGSVRREGSHVRVNAQLIDAIDGHHLWAERYDGEMSGVFGLQDKVIGQIVSTLSVKLTSAEKSVAAVPETTNPQAYDTLLRGWEHLRRDSEAETVAASAFFQKAIILDPDYSRAYASLAAANWRASILSWDFSRREAASRNLARNLAKAMERPTPLAYAVSAQVLAQQGRYDEAFAAIDRAMKLAPNDPDNHVGMARILNATGRAPEAEQEARLAMRFDPHPARATLRMLAVSLFSQGKYDEAADAFERVIGKRSDLLGDYATLISAYGQLGRTGDIQGLTDQYNKLAASSLGDPLTVQESAYDWYGSAFSYHRPYIALLQEGLRKAGLPEGAGTDLAFDDYAKLMTMAKGELSVERTIKVDVAEVKALLARGVTFIDVRAPLTYDNGHLPKAVNLSLLTGLSKESLAKVAGKADEVAFYCQGRNCTHAAYASAKAIAWGYTHVYYFAGGFLEWDDEGYPLVIEVRK